MKLTQEALQDVSGGDDDDGNGDDDDPGGDDPHGGAGSAKDRSKEVRKGLVSMIRLGMLMQPSKEM